jgi:secondary thiamine-phosphate synthase enzyme
MVGRTMVRTSVISLESTGGFDVHNITDRFKKFIETAGVAEGVGLVYYQHTTGTVIVAEHEAGIIADLEDMLETVAPENGTYLHHTRGVDRNGHAHLRSALMGATIALPVCNGKLHIGTYQDILIIDMQTGRNHRDLVFQVIGE